MKTPLLALIVIAAGCNALAQPSGQKTYCNPIDIDYKYGLEEVDKRISYRSGADPVIVPFKGAYYLFVTNSGGWWKSPDLLHWTFVTPSQWPEGDMCAPAALSVRDTLYLLQSSFDPTPLYQTTTPWDGHLNVFNPHLPSPPGALGPWDPDIFHDEDSGRWFLYFGSSNLYPIYGIELDQGNRFSFIGTSRELLYLRPDVHGWERFGRDHRDTIKPFIEGAWMTKHGGRYYLQYAAPGTEYNVYANGTYVGDDPLGPFTYAPYSPVSYKPGGFLTGAGHGNTFEDNFGNFWNTGTPWVAVNFNFERRIAMFPAGFDGDGEMYANTRFGDFPHYIPTRRWKDRNELFTGWMLISYRKPCTASSALNSFSPSNVTDEDPRTFWVSGSKRAGEWLMIDLQQECTVNAVQVNYTDYASNIFRRDSTLYTQFKVSCSPDGTTWEVIADLSGEKRDRPNAYIEALHPSRARYVRFEHLYVGATYLAVSDLRVFGNGGGKPPATPSGLSVRRDNDPRNAFITWDPVPGAVGYNVLWGIAEKKLYQAYQVFSDHRTTLELRALNAGQNYSVAVEAFNESGVSKPTGTVSCR